MPLYVQSDLAKAHEDDRADERHRSLGEDSGEPSGVRVVVRLSKAHLHSLDLSCSRQRYFGDSG